MFDTLRRAKSFIYRKKSREELDLPENSHLRRTTVINKQVLDQQIKKKVKKKPEEHKPKLLGNMSPSSEKVIQELKSINSEQKLAENPEISSAKHEKHTANQKVRKRKMVNTDVNILDITEELKNLGLRNEISGVKIRQKQCKKDPKRKTTRPFSESYSDEFARFTCGTGLKTNLAESTESIAYYPTEECQNRKSHEVKNAGEVLNHQVSGSSQRITELKTGAKDRFLESTSKDELLLKSANFDEQDTSTLEKLIEELRMNFGVESGEEIGESSKSSVKNSVENVIGDYQNFDRKLPRYYSERNFNGRSRSNQH